jgi:VanZ family protein
MSRGSHARVARVCAGMSRITRGMCRDGYAAAVRSFAAWLPATAIAVLIFTLSAQPNLQVTDGTADLVLRKLAHMTVFGLLAAACVRGLTFHGITGRAALVGAAALATAYAISDEFHQTFVTGRSGSPIDVAIDVVGILVAVALLARSPRLRARILAPA